MSSQVGVVRDNDTLKQAIASLQDLDRRAQAIDLKSSNPWSNQGLIYARQLQEMIRLGIVIASSALARDECRGAHYKPAFELSAPQDAYPGDPAYESYREKWKRQNDEWLKTTITEDTPSGPTISFEEVDLSVLPPEQPRDYR
jgi:succinate dehydrogenase / fumarate reductase flavoprotein subunit